MTLVRELPWDACLLEPRRDPELARGLRRETGGLVPAGAFYFGAAPWMPAAIGRLNASLLGHTHMDQELLDYIGLVISQESSCRYCFATQRFMRIGMGTSADQIDRFERDFLVAAGSERERAALEFARRVARANPLATPEDHAALLDAGFSADELREILSYSAILLFFNRLSTQSALPPAGMEQEAERRLLRVFRPLVKLQMRRMHRTRTPVPLGPYDGPFAPVLCALDGLHGTASLRDFVEGLWTSGVVAPRSLALICAVVSRALGCERGEAAACGLASEEGLAPDAVRGILDHLGGPELDAFEQIALPYARETAWVQAAQVTRLQRLARDVQARMSEAEFVTLLATTSLANALCRVGAALPAD